MAGGAGSAGGGSAGGGATTGGGSASDSHAASRASIASTSPVSLPEPQVIESATAVARVDDVVTAEGRYRVGARPAGDDVGQAVAGQAVGAGAAAHVLDLVVDVVALARGALGACPSSDTVTGAAGPRAE